MKDNPNSLLILLIRLAIAETSGSHQELMIHKGKQLMKAIIRKPLFLEKVQIVDHDHRKPVSSSPEKSHNIFWAWKFEIFWGHIFLPIPWFKRYDILKTYYLLFFLQSPEKLIIVIKRARLFKFSMILIFRYFQFTVKKSVFNLLDWEDYEKLMNMIHKFY